MAYLVASESLEAVRPAWVRLLPQSATNTVFVTPEWQLHWYEHFGGERPMQVLSVRDVSGSLVGVAPLLDHGCKLSFVGATDVCDYLDLLVERDHAQGALPAVLDFLAPQAWNCLSLHCLPAASPTLALLPGIARARDWRVEITQEEVCPRVDLPTGWEEYVASLGKKDRHELRRKFRRLNAAGDVRFVRNTTGDGLDQELDDFFRLHRLSRDDKAEFMTLEMEEFFRHTIGHLAGDGTAGLYFLDVDGARTAAIIFFDYNGERLLYNSGYDPHFASLSVGLLLKAYSLRNAIESGLKRFDFLRGDEPYKYDLGGINYPIYKCVVSR